MVAFVPEAARFGDWIIARARGRRRSRQWAEHLYRYSFAIMVASSRPRFWPAVQVAALSFRGFLRRQFITRNRRLAFVLTMAVVGIGIAVVQGPARRSDADGAARPDQGAERAARAAGRMGFGVDAAPGRRRILRRRLRGLG